MPVQRIQISDGCMPYRFQAIGHRFRVEDADLEQGIIFTDFWRTILDIRRVPYDNSLLLTVDQVNEYPVDEKASWYFKKREIFVCGRISATIVPDSRDMAVVEVVLFPQWQIIRDFLKSRFPQWKKLGIRFLSEKNEKARLFKLMNAGADLSHYVGTVSRTRSSFSSCCDRIENRDTLNETRIVQLTPNNAFGQMHYSG